jgi:hypothetical protein
MTTLVNALYCGQLTYQKITENSKKKFDRIKPLNNKIQNHQETIETLDLKLIGEKIDNKKWQKIKTRAEGREPAVIEDLRIIRARYEEKIANIKNRIDTSLKEENSRENYIFETNRSRFYRNLQEQR